jgi:hypothetical protein
MSVCLFTIDPQVDFCEGGALPVTGATKDLERLSNDAKNVQSIDRCPRQCPSRGVPVLSQDRDRGVVFC